MQEKQHQKKIQRLVLELNKSGLAHLEKDQIGNAFTYFKQAQKLLLDQIKVTDHPNQILRYQAVTFNNLAIYYKRTNKPKSALSYLKKAVEIQTYELKDWIATASTHLNICAIYSYMGKHYEAVQHAQLALEMVSKAEEKKNKQNEKNQQNGNKIILAANYNIGVEYQYLKMNEKAMEFYKRTQELARKSSAKQMEQKCSQNIARLQQIIRLHKKKVLDALLKKKQNDEKSHYESMRKNKKHYQKNSENLQKSKMTKKYQLYDEGQKPHQSFQKLQKIPIGNRGINNTNSESQGAMPRHHKVIKTRRDE